ncbi:unnamed protein product [Spirodela intermedia]|uniref:Uncharacterized protein n=1 Tax=Spirodela intermedia TaxID=51605 RepID=A0A7I8J1Y4_SPIIN|nr:unnamed protein product [Spirodela intermedia]CAA6663823.1 unnamed protein product [Spirodela intermedia]
MEASSLSLSLSSLQGCLCRKGDKTGNPPWINGGRGRRWRSFRRCGRRR